MRKESTQFIRIFGRLTLTLFLSETINSQTILWPAGYQGLVGNEQNKSFFVQYKDGIFQSDTTKSIHIPVEASCLAYCDPKTDKLLFYSNGCKIFDSESRIISGSERLNEGLLANQVCEKYGYLMDYNMIAIQYPGDESRVIIVHMSGEDINDPYYQYTSLLYTTIHYDSGGINLRIENINTALLSNKNLMPLSICRHANGRDWWLVCAEKLHNVYHVFLINSNGINYQGTQSIGTSISATECIENQRLLFSPNADLLARHTNCGICFLNFDRCDGLLSFNTFQELPFHPSPGGDIAFSYSGRYLYVSRWSQMIRIDMKSIGIYATPYTINKLGRGNLIHHMSLLPSGEILVDVPNSEKSMHIISNTEDVNNYLFSPNFVRFPFHIMRSMPHLITADPGRLIGSPCDSMKTNLVPVVNQQNFYLFPNPSFESIILKNIRNYPIQSVRIINLEGQTMFKKEKLDHSTNLVLDISNLISGTYYLQVLTDRRFEILKFSKL